MSDSPAVSQYVRKAICEQVLAITADPPPLALCFKVSKPMTRVNLEELTNEILRFRGEIHRQRGIKVPMMIMNADAEIIIVEDPTNPEA